MKFSPVLITACLFLTSCLMAQESNGLAPEVTDLGAADVSFALEAKLPDLKEPFIDFSPSDRRDGITVGQLGMDASSKDVIETFAAEIAAGDHGAIDSLLLFHDGRLLFESYYRRGRINYPHYQMSITKSYTAMAIGRALELGHLTMADINKPVVSFIKNIDQKRMVRGASEVTLAEAMNMRSGIRLNPGAVTMLRKTPELLRGQGQVQAFFQYSSPIPPSPREFKYQGSDPSMTMQVLDAVVPVSAKDFIESELLGRMGITRFGWQEDISGYPKSAAGSSMCSRDMIKWGMLVLDDGKWNGEQLIPSEFVQQATRRLHTNRSGSSYGFFWWRHDMTYAGKQYDCISGRGAGGQFIFVLPGLNLIAAVTSHNKGMGAMLKTFPQKVLPAFVE